jgi:hypothetical protein
MFSALLSAFVVDKDDNPETETIDEELDIQEQQQQTSFDLSEVGEIIKVASEGALTAKTIANYRRSFLFQNNC